MAIGIRSAWRAPDPTRGDVDNVFVVTWYCTETGHTVKREVTDFTPAQFDNAQKFALVELRQKISKPAVFQSLVHDDARCKTGRDNMCNECRMIADADTCEYCGKTNPPDARCCEEPNE